MLCFSRDLLVDADVDATCGDKAASDGADITIEMGGVPTVGGIGVGGGSGGVLCPIHCDGGNDTVSPPSTLQNKRKLVDLVKSKEEELLRMQEEFEDQRLRIDELEANIQENNEIVRMPKAFELAKLPSIIDGDKQLQSVAELDGVLVPPAASIEENDDAIVRMSNVADVAQLTPVCIDEEQQCTPEVNANQRVV
jgi:hypothetical protein